MDSLTELKVQYRSSPNIAWVKYWGKYDQDYILPINDSLGVTLNSDDIYTQTTITFTNKLHSHQIMLNNEQHKISKRMQKMFTLIKRAAFDKIYSKITSQEEWNKYYFDVESVNSFPTASGMASSASGLACLAVALNGLFGDVLGDAELSELARLGSGSASRSVCGGLVRWKGVPQKVLTSKTQADRTLLQQLSKQCISTTVIPYQKLQQIKILILLATNKQKQISSTSGMQTSTQTSELIKYRNGIANNRIELILQNLHQFQQKIGKEEEIVAFNCVVENIIKDSNQFHAICLDTYPPIFYLNEFSKQIIHIVDSIINPVSTYKVAYTFDAGPHAFLFMHESVQFQVLNYFSQLFSLPQESYNSRAREKLQQAGLAKGDGPKFEEYKGVKINPYQIWSTSVGRGAYKIG